MKNTSYGNTLVPSRLGRNYKRQTSWGALQLSAGLALGLAMLLCQNGLADGQPRGGSALNLPGIDVGQSALPPGEHPRVLFSAADLPAIRERMSDPVGAAAWNSLNGVFSKDLLRQLEVNDPDWVAAQRVESRQEHGRYPGICMSAAFVARVEGDSKKTEAAVQLFRVWLDAFTEEEASEPVRSWGFMQYALAYDWLHHALTEEDRVRARRLLVRMLGEPTRDMFDTDFHLLAGTSSRRFTSNFTAICASSLTLTALAIEGEAEVHPDILPLAIHCFRSYLQDAISPEGGMYEGTHYSVGAFGSHTVPHLILAMRRRGVDLLPQSHLDRIPTWMAYELLPWGGEANAFNKASGQMAVGAALPTFLAQEYDGLADYLFANGNPPPPDPISPHDLLTLINGIPAVRPVSPGEAKLPLSRWFSTTGMVFCRDRWDDHDATHWSFNVNFIGQGHSHADHGSFCLASHGALFFGDGHGSPGLSSYASESHNLVHIDGVAQSLGESAVESFIRSVETGAYADVIDIDQKLAYDRVLANEMGGKRAWRLYNPVQHADRRSLFVRGATGPLIMLSDQIRKDSRQREYEWLGRSEAHNHMSADGARFQIVERFGGKFMRSLTKGAVTTLSREGAPSGKYRAWALVRGEPGPPQWANNVFAVNGRVVPWRTTYFGRGNHRGGWSWLRLKPGGDDEIDVDDKGELKAEIRWNTGGRVALLVFSRDPQWEPTGLPPEDGGEFVVMGAADALEGGGDWQVMERAQGVLDGWFMGPTPPELTVYHNFKETRQPVLSAKLNDTSGRYLAVFSPSDATRPRPITLGDDLLSQSAIVRNQDGIDILGGSVNGEPVTGELETDALAASVSYDAQGKLLGYAMLEGTYLRCRGETLVEKADRPVQITVGRGDARLRAPGGTTVRCVIPDQTKLFINGLQRITPTGEMVELNVPPVSNSWRIEISGDGRKVEATGDGPQPLLIAAPRAVECVVNGVSRYFVRTEDGRISPVLSRGTLIYQTLGEVEAGVLLDEVDPETPAKGVDAAVFDPTMRGRRILVAAGGTLKLNRTLAPGAYAMMATVAGEEPCELSISIDGESLGSPVQLPGSGQFVSTGFEKFTARKSSSALDLKTSSGTPLALQRLVLFPELQTIGARHWMAIGPFPSPWRRGDRLSAAAVKAGLDAVHPPEKEIDPDGVYSLADDAELRWARHPGADGEERVDFKRILGVKRGEISYAATVVTSPDERSALLSIEVDWWANAWVNGVPVVGTRDPSAVERDGAQFSKYPAQGWPAEIRLRKGVNEILVKAHGGSAGNFIRVMISNPGDLEFRSP